MFIDRRRWGRKGEMEMEREKEGGVEEERSYGGEKMLVDG